MLNIIIKAVFSIIAFIGGIILSPITALVNVFIPDFSSYISGILTFLTNITQYIPFVCKLLMIPSFCLQSVILLFTAYLTFKIGFNTYKLILKLYNKFKP